MTAVPPWKKIVMEQLEMLSSEAGQLQYEANVPHVDITRELIEGWCSDSYHPNDGVFAACFSEAEREALSEFNQLLVAALPVLPPSGGTVSNWLRSPVWKELMLHAARTRQQIAG
jgi:hypothetical protein